jgi:hypothetical protein
MFCLFAATLVTLIVHFLKTKMEFTLTKVCLVLIMAFSILRAVFFLLFALEKLGSIQNNSPSGYFVKQTFSVSFF